METAPDQQVNLNLVGSLRTGRFTRSFRGMRERFTPTHAIHYQESDRLYVGGYFPKDQEAVAVQLDKPSKWALIGVRPFNKTIVSIRDHTEPERADYFVEELFKRLIANPETGLDQMGPWNVWDPTITPRNYLHWLQFEDIESKKFEHYREHFKNLPFLKKI